MANKYKNTQTLNPALRSIGNMNVRGVVKGGTSDADKKARYGLPVMVSETGYIDPSLLEGGSVGGGTTENRVVELIKNNLQPYNDGQEIKDDIDGKASKSELPDIIKNQLQQNTEIKNEISNVIKEQIQQGSEVKTEITNIVGETLTPYANGQEIKNEVDGKVNITDYNADFVVFDTQTGSTKGEKIKNYIDNITPPIPENVIEKTDMSPYGQADKTQTGTEIENAIGEKVATTTYENDFATFASEAGSTIGEKIRNAITGGTQGGGVTEEKLSECLSPYSTSSADITEIGTKIKADTNSKVATDKFNSEFAVFDDQTGTTKGEKIKAYIDDHGGAPTAILQADMSPYGQGDKAQTGAEIQAAIANAGKTDEQIKQLIINEITQGGSPVNEKITEKITEKLQPYNSGQEIKDAIDAKPNAEDVVAVTDMSPFGTTNKQYIGTEIVAKIEDIIAENLGEEGDITVTIKDRANSVTKTVLSQSMSPYSQSVGDIAEIGSKIKNDVNLKVNTTDYDADFNNFDAEQGATKGAKIQSYINKELTGGLANKVDISAMSPYNGNPQQIGTAIENAINAATKTDEQIKDLAKQQITTEAQAGGVIDTAIDAKIGDNLLEKTDLAPYGQTDKTQIGAEIAAAIQSAGGGHTDERIKELAEEKIVADVAGGGTIDTAISNKLTTEKVLRQGDLAPYGATEISQTGKDIQDAINAVDAKIEANAVVPTDMGEFYTDDKTKIGENIKNAILAAGGGSDPSNPSVKQSDLAPYGVADVTQAGADIQNGINTAISNAFAPYTNGQSISEEQAQQNVEFNKKIKNVDDSIVPTIKDTLGYNGFKVEEATIIASPFSYNQAFIYVKGNNSYTFVDPKDGKLKRLKCDTDTIEEIAQLTYNTSHIYRFLKCYSEPNFIICLWGETGNQGLNAFSRDGGQTWSVFTNPSPGFSYLTTPFFFKDKNGNYFLIDRCPRSTWGLCKLQVDNLSADIRAAGPVTDLSITYEWGLLNDNIILPNRDGNFYKSMNYNDCYYIYNGCYMRNITPQNWNDIGAEQFKNIYLRIVFADGRKEDFDGASTSQMYSMIKIGNKLLAFAAKKVADKSYLAMAVCDDIHDHWDDPQTPLEFHEVTAKDNKLNGKTLAAGFLNLSDYGGEYAKNGLSSYYYYNYYGSNIFGQNDLPIIHIDADRYVYMIGMQNQNADYSGNPIPIGMRLDLEKHEVTDEPLTVDLPTGNDGSYFNVWPCCYQYNIGCYKKEWPFYQIIKRGRFSDASSYWYYAKILRKSAVVDSFQVGDIMVTCRKMGESWLECDGSTFEATKYPLLAEIIKDLTLPTGTPSFLTGGTTTFKVYIKAK